MSKYSFERLGSDRFEAMAQALLEKNCRVGGHLVQFGEGPDGARETTWTQPADHPQYKRPKNEIEDVPKEWVFQAKYHDIGMRGWAGARATTEDELDAELDKIVNKYTVPCHKYILITNVPFSGVRHIGTRDRVGTIIKRWESKIAEIEVWDAVDLSRMLDADPNIRTTYLDAILPGDVLCAMLHETNYSSDRRKSAFRAYLKSLVRSERDAKADEAGDEGGLRLEEVFVDLDLKLIKQTNHQSINVLLNKLKTCEESNDDNIPNSQLPQDFDQTPSSFALLRAGHSSILLKGGPGSGKSTLTQFLALYYAARLVDSQLAKRLAGRLNLTGGVTPNDLDYHVAIRFPLRIELRRYAQWIDDQSRTSPGAFLAQYIVDRVNAAASSDLDMDSIFALAATNPLLVILDGLDEVPNVLTRNTIFHELQVFLDRCNGESCDVQLIMSSRPQGYRGEFDGFEPIEWETVPLKRAHFDEYCSQWLQSRIENDEERRDAHQRINEGMESVAVQQLAGTLLQATVMLTIVRRKHAIPHARHKLFDKYVDVIFERERNKLTVRKFDNELRQLHKLVGYELLCKMEQAKGERTIRDDEFRSYVMKVIEDYSSSDFEDKTISAIVDEISIMSKDRLCLLSGKGDNQDEIDFVIQPFREYFAAAYLASHEDAEPERVFDSLVRRSNVWSDVLQFYAAFQNMAQQKVWISEADGTGQDLSKVDGLLNITRNRHSLLQILPEFERPKNEYIQRALINLLHPSTRWTFAEKGEDVTTLLRAFSRDVPKRLIDLFSNISITDHGNLFVELDLLARFSSESNNKFLLDILNKTIDDEQTRLIGLTVAIGNDIPVNLSKCTAANIWLAHLHVKQANPRYYRKARFNKFISKLSIEQETDLIYGNYSGYSLFRLHDQANDSLHKKLFEFIFSFEDIFSGDRALFTFDPFAMDRSKNESNTELLSYLENASSPISNFIYKLILAVINPTDVNFDRTARQAALILKEQHRINIEEQLGPDPSLFPSVEDWQAYKANLYKMSKNAKNQIGPILAKEPTAWQALLFHPVAWDELRDLVTDATLNALEQTDWCQVQRYLMGHVLPVSLSSLAFDKQTAKHTSIYDLCQAVMKAVQKYGAYCVLRNPSLQNFLLEGDLELNVTTEQAEELLELAISLPERLPTIWAEVIMLLFMQAGQLDIKLLLQLWQQHFFRSVSYEHLGLKFPTIDTTIIEHLLDYGTVDSVTLAAYLSRSGDRGSRRASLPANLHGRLISHLARLIIDVNLEPKERVRSLDALKYQPLHIAELRLWLDPQILKTAVGHDALWVYWICGKIRDIGYWKFKIDQTDYRKELSVFVENRQKYPRQIVLAAMESLLRLDEINTPALKVKDWQAVS